MIEKRFKKMDTIIDPFPIWDNVEEKGYNCTDTLDLLVDLLNEQQSTIEKQKKIIKSQDAEISRQYNLCLAMSGVLREEFGVYDVFDRTKDKKRG